MHFFVDESGHTGPNLFDEAQPVLYYGVISTRRNIDQEIDHILQNLRAKFEVDRLHAAELGIRKLEQISNSICQLHKRFQIRFSIYRVFKPDHAAICFFDQVFDQGLNPAVTWSGYWTPLRYFLFFKVAYLFDLETLKLAWEARIETNDSLAIPKFIEVCNILRKKINLLPDQRSRQLIGDALEWATKHPEKIDYNASSKKELLTITPNLIGFQSVMHGIASIIRQSKTPATRIVVDQQSQFNKGQKDLATFYSGVKNCKFVTGPELPELDFSNIPSVPITFSSSKNSSGLELVDIYLWIFKKYLEKFDLPAELMRIIQLQSETCTIQDISISGLMERWAKWFSQIPEPTPEALERAKELIALDEARRLSGMSEQ